MARKVLEHVAAANPEPSPAALSEHEQAERDAIRAMVLADALPPATVTPARRRRRVTLALAAAAACAAIVVAVTVSGRDAPFVDRAYAAVTASGLFHVIEVTSIDAPPAVFESEPFEAWRSTRTEAWYDRGDRASHFIVSELRGGRFVPVYETAWKNGTQLVRGADGRVDELERLDAGSASPGERRAPVEPPEHYAVSLFEDAYREEKVRDDGDVTVDGRRLRRLVLDIPPARGAPGPVIGQAEQAMLFDPETRYPVQLTSSFSITIDDVEHPVRITTRFPTFERLAETDENRAKLSVTR